MMRSFALLLLVGTFCGCATRESAPQDLHLSASLPFPVDVQLKWTPAPGNPAGYVVEWTPDPGAEFVTLAFLYPNITSYLHAQLMPHSKNYYRVRAYYGLASAPVQAQLPEALSETDYTNRFERPEDYSWAIPQTVPGSKATQASIRNSKTMADAAPADLKAELMPLTVSGFKLTWLDRARDEEGFLVEGKLEKTPDFQVVATLAPNINSFGYAFEPPTRKGLFRVRAIYYGKPSNRVEQTTGSE